MSKTIATTVYQFDELSDSAKEHARQWFRDCMDSSDYADAVIEDAAECARILGIEFDTHEVRLMSGKTRQDVSVWWSGFSSQGDGASFDGAYRYAPGAVKAIREHTGNNETLVRIAQGLQDIQRKHFYSLHARCKQSGHYSHSGCMDVEVFDSRNEYRDIGDADKTVRDLLRKFADWIYRQLESEYEYQSSDERVDENICANEYTFTASGKRFG